MLEEISIRLLQLCVKETDHIYISTAISNISTRYSLTWVIPTELYFFYFFPFPVNSFPSTNSHLAKGVHVYQFWNNIQALMVCLKRALCRITSLSCSLFMIDLEMIWEEARREVTRFAEDSGILTGWEVQEHPSLLSS